MKRHKAMLIIFLLVVSFSSARKIIAQTFLKGRGISPTKIKVDPIVKTTFY